MPFHRFLEQFQCSFAVPRLGDNAFQHLSLMIDGAPQVVRNTIDFHKHPAPEAAQWPISPSGTASPAIPAVAPRPVMH